MKSVHAMIVTILLVLLIVLSATSYIGYKIFHVEKRQEEIKVSQKEINETITAIAQQSCVVLEWVPILEGCE